MRRSLVFAMALGSVLLFAGVVQAAPLKYHGTTISFLGSFPDLAEAVASMGGRSGPSARLRFALKRRKAARVLVYLVGSNVEERRTRSGLGRALGAHLVEQMRLAGYTSLIAALMAENSPARPLLAGQGGGSEREYVLYRFGH